MDIVLYTATITSFLQIEILPKTLVVLDIDETILQFPEIHELWWRERRDYYKNIGHDDPKIINTLTYNEWLDHVTETTPRHTDKDGLFDPLAKIIETYSHIIFLTARFGTTDELTQSHL